MDNENKFVRTERFLSETGAARYASRILPAGSVAFVCIGATIGKTCVVDRPTLTNQRSIHLL